MKNYWKNFLISSIVAFVITGTIALSKGVFSQVDIKETMKILCDAFFVAGVIFVCLGALIYCSSKGAFLAFRYMIHITLVTHNWSRTRFKDRQTYREYREEKLANPKEIPSYIFHVGLIFTVVSVIFLILYYNV